MDFAKKYAAAAMEATAGTDIFPAVVLSAAALESGWAGSGLSSNYNNFFGVKAGSTWFGKTVTMPTKEEVNGQMVTVNAKFRAYDSALDSFRDYVRLLQTSRYNKAGVSDAATPAEQIQRIKDAGYATDSNYANKVISIINTLTTTIPELKKKAK